MGPCLIPDRWCCHFWRQERAKTELVMAEENTQSCALDSASLRRVPSMSWLSESVSEGRRLCRNSAEKLGPVRRAEAVAGFAGERRT